VQISDISDVKKPKIVFKFQLTKNSSSNNLWRLTRLINR